MAQARGEERFPLLESKNNNLLADFDTLKIEVGELRSQLSGSHEEDREVPLALEAYGAKVYWVENIVS